MRDDTDIRILLVLSELQRLLLHIAVRFHFAFFFLISCFRNFVLEVIFWIVDLWERSKFDLLSLRRVSAKSRASSIAKGRLYVYVFTFGQDRNLLFDWFWREIFNSIIQECIQNCDDVGFVNRGHFKERQSNFRCFFLKFFFLSFISDCLIDLTSNDQDSQPQI